MALLSIDELNTPKVEVEPPEQYFSKMAISKEQKEERVETANDFMDVLLFFFALLAIEMESVSPDYDMVYRKFKKRFRDVVADHSRMDDYQDNYVDEYTLQQYELTRRHMEAAGVGSGNTDAGWWTSADRAMAIGENAANIILNHEELLQAAEAGAVGKKWIDKADNRVRKSHLAVTKKIIPLEEYFVVGDGIMLFPCDWDNNPDECHRCRCVLAYYDKDGKRVITKKGENARYTNENKYDNIISNRALHISADKIESRNTIDGNANAISILGAGLNERQKRLLERLPKFDSRTTARKKDVKMSDLAALTAYTGVEFAMFTRRGERLIIRGDQYGVNVNKEYAEELRDMGYKWSGHTHPGIDFSFCNPSPGDKEVLSGFKQERSVIYNSNGQYEVFSQ